jgi:hypothetical protein
MMSVIEVPRKPFVAKQRSAAWAISDRRASRYASVTFGISRAPLPLLTILGCGSIIKNEHSFWMGVAMESPSTPSRGATPFGRAIGIGAALSLVVGLIVLAFAWPAVTAEPKDLPVAVAGPEASVEQVESRVADQAEGAVALERVDDREAAIAAIERREVYGAIILGDAPTDAPEVLVASAASPVVAQTLRATAAELQQGIEAELRAQLPSQLQAVLRRRSDPPSRPPSRRQPVRRPRRRRPSRPCPSSRRSP